MIILPDSSLSKTCTTIKELSMKAYSVISLFIASLILVACTSDQGNEQRSEAEHSSAASQTTSTSASAETERPNFLIVMADDLGFTDIGVFGSEIRTPTIDELASESLSFNQFYASPNCSPSRSMLMTGLDHHFTGFATMQDHIADNQRGQPGYEGYIPEHVATLPEVMQANGYHTSMSGKWHLGAAPGRRPIDKGFDRSTALMQGGAAHLNLDKMLSVFPETVIFEDNVKVESVPDDFYSSKYYADNMIEYIDDALAQDKPFFGWLAFTAPHWPLQVPDEHIDLYAGEYDGGYDLLRETRLQDAIAAGLVPPEVNEVPRLERVIPWDELSEDEKRYQARIMEIYAAMVERLDYHMSRVIDHLVEAGEYDNTLIIFMSDNGAEGHDRMQLLDNATWVPANYDLSYEQLGRAGSYTFLGPGWGQAAVAPLRLFKAYTTEGGIRVPFIVKPPGANGDAQWVNSVATIQDIMPTLMEYAGIENHGSNYMGREVYPMTGRSMFPLIQGESDQIYADDEPLGWEIFGHRALRKGDWKALWADGANGSDTWQLYNLTEDPREINDLSAEFPEKLAELVADWEEYAENNQVVLPIGDMGNPN